MSSQDAFITLVKASAANAKKYKQAALSLIRRTETSSTKSVLIAAQAAAYRAEKAIALLEEALTFSQAARAADIMGAALVNLDMCENHLGRVNIVANPVKLVSSGHLKSDSDLAGLKERP